MEGDSPAPFEAVGGHRLSIFYGEKTRDGLSTIRKTTTAWEIMYYLAMELAKEDTLAQLPTSAQPDADGARGKFIHAAGKLANFTPALFSIRFPEKYVSKSTALRPYMEHVDEWIVLEAGSPARSVVLALLFNELFDGAEQLKSFDADYDTATWGIGLIDETSGMQKPCVMDIKVGFIRHSPLTPKDKIERMVKKERDSLMRNTALRICGLRRYVRASTGTEGVTDTLQCERYGKAIGYAMSDVCELSSCLKMFLSIGEPIAEIKQDGLLVVRSKMMGAATATERTHMEQRVSQVRAELKLLIDFFEGTPDGAFLLQHMAFVSTSLLLLYDAGASPATARLRFIDFARSTWRRFNFGESTVGFVQGLKNLDAYISL
ncbi:hypothetical protein JIQ42_01091 [Leishmania sp. Namibia]|uniref:hypothetical protein n=1 Tax=Leishmania sp. Namibia TaxID=2802991 RepID=UPI001B49AB9D|nr:hypothetical protein JIQ42_01091 [Leishmania sp. Namibia]